MAGSVMQWEDDLELERMHHVFLSAGRYPQFAFVDDDDVLFEKKNLGAHHVHHCANFEVYLTCTDEHYLRIMFRIVLFMLMYNGCFSVESIYTHSNLLGIFMPITPRSVLYTMPVFV
jgi:hypothetical protein